MGNKIKIEPHTSLPKSDPHHIFPPPPPQEPPPQISGIVKLAFIGNTGTGKTSCIRRYTLRDYDHNGCSTSCNATNYSYTKRDVCLSYDNDAILCTRVQMWDTSGQDRFFDLTKSCLRRIQADGVVIVCSILDVLQQHDMHANNNQIHIPIHIASSKFRNDIDKWKRLLPATDGARFVPVVLFVNQMDQLLDDDGKAADVSPCDIIQMGQNIEQMCRDMGICKWFATSAKSNEGVDDGINYLIRAIVRSRGGKTNLPRVTPKEERQSKASSLETIDEDIEKKPQHLWSIDFGQCIIS